MKICTCIENRRQKVIKVNAELRKIQSLKMEH